MSVIQIQETTVWRFKRQVAEPLPYKKLITHDVYRIDLLRENKVRREIKMETTLAEIYKVPFMTDIKPSCIKVG